MSEDRLPTSLWVDAHLRRLDTEGIPYYIINKGEYASGIILLKLNGLEEGCRLLIQQRDFENDELCWTHALSQEDIEENAADDYIQRAIARDPDLWVIEIEERAMVNPFEGKVI